MTESEATALVPLLLAASVLTIAWVFDLATLPIHPLAVLVVSIAGVALGGLLVSRSGRGSRRAPSAQRFAGFVAVSCGFAAYVCWLAWPSLLPLTDGPDLVHHLSLIHFVQRRHALPDDPVFANYLGEMASYTPGSHLLAALAAEWFRTDAVRLVHALLAAAVAIKAGVVYNTLARVLPQAPGNVASSIAGTLLLLVPHRYLLEPLTVFGFYSQVIAEMFAVGTLWAIVAWDQRPSRARLAIVAVFCVGVVLCWPVYFPVPALAVMVVVALHWKRGRPAVSAVGDVLAALAPALVTAVIFSARHASSAGILRSGGSVLEPSVDTFGWPFLLLAIVGCGLAIRRVGTLAPVVAFAVACLVQITVLAVAQASLGATNLYLANKTIFLLVYPVTVFAALALDYVSGWIARGVGFASGADGRRKLASACGLVGIAALLMSGDLPRRPLTSPLSETVYRVGMWAKANVPAGCVDYLVDRWITGYWLHLDMLGNPRASERLRTETFEYRPTVSRWIVPDGARFAIVEDLADVPADARRNMQVLYQSGAAAVVRRADGGGTCADEAPGIDHVGIGSR